MSPSGAVPNHWHISIRKVPLEPSGHLIFVVQPDSHYVVTEGPIEQTLGQAIDLQSDATTLIITRLLLESFVNREPNMGRPWYWSTNDGAIGERVVAVMRRLGVEESVLNMPVSSNSENRSCEEDWERFLENLTAMTGR
jgi:hypothetical protein